MVAYLSLRVEKKPVKKEQAGEFPPSRLGLRPTSIATAGLSRADSGTDHCQRAPVDLNPAKTALPTMAWATFLNSFFIFARDAGFLYTLFEGTMSFFAGVRIPLFAFPLWIRIIGIIFPLTTSLVVLRGALLEAATPATLWPQLLLLAGISIALFVATAWLLKRGEENARRSGSLTLF